MTERKYNGSSTNRATYLYGADGSLSQTVDHSVGTRTQFTYDLADRLVSRKDYATTAKNGGTLRSSTDYTYADKTNYLTGIKHFSPLGTQNIGYTYGDISKGEMPDQIYKVSWNEKEKVSNHYDALGRLAGKFIFTDGLPLTYAYSYENVEETRTSMLVSGVRTPFGVYRYSYDAVGNIKSISFGTKYTNTYEYDALNQLVRENNQQIGKTYTYTYQNGNITERKEYAYTTGTLPEQPQYVYSWSYANDTWGDLLTDFNGIQITYDEIGNPTAIDEVALSWNGRQLQQVSDGGNTYSYAYNIDGQRVSKTVTESNGTVKTTEYFYNGSILAGQKAGEDTLVFMYDDKGTAFGFTYNGTEYYYLKNAQGDVDAVVDSNRQIVAKYAYDAWGKVISVTDADGVDIWDYTHIGHINPIRYRGYYYDRESNFYYLNSRYYAPDICRFLNADGFYDTDTGILSHNMFAYCNNNPVNGVDSNGMITIGAVLAAVILAAISCVVAAYLKGESPSVGDIPKAVVANEVPIYDAYNTTQSCKDDMQKSQNKKRIHSKNMVNVANAKRKNSVVIQLENIDYSIFSTDYDYMVYCLNNSEHLEEYTESTLGFSIEGKCWDELTPEMQSQIENTIGSWDPQVAQDIGKRTAWYFLVDLFV